MPTVSGATVSKATPPVVTIRELKDHVGEEVTLQGWLYNMRSKGKLETIQRGVSNEFLVQDLMYGERDDPYAGLSGLSRHLRETTVPGEALRAITATITRTLKLPYAAIELATVRLRGRAASISTPTAD